jgi:hypothetical protein
MKISYVFILIGMILSPFALFAEESGASGFFIQTYADYQKAVKNVCESENVPWANYKNALTLKVIKPEYSELTGSQVATTWQKLPSEGKTSEAQSRLQTELDAKLLDPNSLFSSVKLAGVQYRKVMDETYACAVLDSRANVLRTLREQIEKNGTEMTEIRTKMKSAEAVIKKTKQEQGCKDITIKGHDTKRELLDATMYQHCVYRHYLAYVETNMRYQANTLIAQEQEARKTLGSKSIALRNTDQYLIIVNNLV